MGKNGILAALLMLLIIIICFCLINLANAYYGLYGYGLYGGSHYGGLYGLDGGIYGGWW